MRSVVLAIAALLSAPVLALAQPIGHWRFNETAGATASNSAAGANGTLVGNAAFTTGGISGNCVNFPTYGGGYVTMGNTYNIDANPEFTISAWARTTNTTNPKVVVSRHFTGIFNGYILCVDLGGAYANPQRGQFYLNDFPGSTCNGATVLTDGQWHHLVAVYRFIGTGTIRELWVDGIREAANANAGPNPHPSPSFLVGGIFFSSGGETGYFQGQIDEVQVYNYAVTSADIAILRATPAAVAAPKQCFCDFNGDNQRNTADLVIFLARFAQPTSNFGDLGDVNYDSAVNTQDLTIFLARFGQPC
ncbi:MAG: LamG-like jellyroll fold domain-containing protein [Phycisphaerales bacterium]